MELIKSRQNDGVKLARSLHNKKARDEKGLYIMEGRRCLTEAVRTKTSAEVFYYCPEKTDPANEPVIEHFLKKSAAVYRVNPDIMDYISPGKSSQQMLALLRMKNHSLEDLPLKGYFVVLNEVSDPGNLGTVIRSSAAFDCEAVVLAGQCVDRYNPKTVRATAGRILDVPVINIKSIEEVAGFCHRNSVSICFFSPNEGKPFTGGLINRPSAVVFGGEARGFDREIRKNTENLFHLPMNPTVESLNLAVCASVVMEKIYSSF